MADGYITASYNALNQPVAMGSQGLGGNFIWFWHDPLGRCVKRWLGNGNGVPTGAITYLYYDGWSLVQEGPNASTADRLYVHGAGWTRSWSVNMRQPVTGGMPATAKR